MNTTAQVPGASAAASARHDEGANAATVRPTEPQRRYLLCGLSEPGGKLPLFDRNGHEVAARIVEACIARGWAERWCANPIKPDWLVCRLTPEGYAVGEASRPGTATTRLPER